MQKIFSALTGIFDENGFPLEKGVYDAVNHNINFCSVDGLYVNGSTGESFLMSLDKRRAMLEYVSKAAAGRVKLIAHVGSNAVNEALELADNAAALGYDAVSAVTPFYYNFSREEIKNYYRALAKHSALPVILYYIPVRAGASLSREDVLELLDFPNIGGIKFTATDFCMLERMRTMRPDIKIFSGFDEMLFSASVLKTYGAIGSTYNVIGHWAKALVKAVGDGNYDTAYNIQSNMNDVIDMLLGNNLMPTLKAVMSLYGVEAGSCLPPFEPSDSKAAVAAEIKKYIDTVDRDCLIGR